MREIEAFILVILLMMGLPDLLARWRRSSLLYPAYLVAGVLAGPLMGHDADVLLHKVGEFGFILMLFGIGLEIDLPSGAALRRSVGSGLRWLLPQYGVLILAGMAVAMYFGRIPPGTAWREAVVGALPLAGCSIAIAFPAWLTFRGMRPNHKAGLLYMMVFVEILTIHLLSASPMLLGRGGLMDLGLRLGGMAVAIAFVWWGAGRLTGRFKNAFQQMAQWQVHFIVLIVFVFADIGGRLGLSPAKAAFFLGLGMSRVTREGWAIDHHLRPLGQRLLIPVFLISLGTRLPMRLDVLPVLGLAAATSALMMALRDSLYRRWIAPAGSPRGAHWLAGPNLTMVAIALSQFQEAGGHTLIMEWMAFTGLFLTVGSLLFLPRDPGKPSDLQTKPNPVILAVSAPDPSPSPAPVAAPAKRGPRSRS